MTEDGERQEPVFDPALLALLGLARQVFEGCSAWLLLKNRKGQSVVLDERGVVDDLEDPGNASWPWGTVRAVAEESSEVPREPAMVGNRSLVAAVAIADDDKVYGRLLLVAERPRELPPEKRDALKKIARQICLVLERKRMTASLERLRAAERSARESLAEIRGDLRLVTDQVLEVLCKTDLTGAIWSINPSAERELGYGRGELIGRNVFDLIHPEERWRAEEMFREAATTGRFDTEIRCQHREGEYLHLVCSGAALLDDCLMPTGYLLAGRNISRWKKAEADLRRLESRFKLVWENSRDAMRLVDGNGIVVQVNDEYCRLVNKTREELIGELFVIAYSYPDPDGEMEGFRRRFADRAIAAHLELSVQLWNGDRRTFDISSSFFEVEDQTLLLTIYRDITERRKEEAELKRLNDALQQRAAYLGALTLKLTRVEQEERRRLAQILHDHLQQLLVAARMTMERVRRRLPKGEDADPAAEVEHLLDESIEASRSITIELSPPVLHDGGLIAALEWLARRMRQKHGLNVNLKADPDADPPSVPLRLFLFQAVRELLFNCYKHAGVPDVSLSVDRTDEECVQIVVKDEGAGFDSVNLSLGAGSSRDCFGLFSLRERMEHLGGSVAIEAAPGEGTTVTLLVPMEPQVTMPSSEDEVSVLHHPAIGGTDAEVEEGTGEKIRLLLVDDHKIMRQGLRELFREEPDMLVVGEAENGLKGLSLAQRLQPDVVVMDIAMPVMNGIEATRILTAEFPEIRVIGLSMHIKEDMAQAMLEAGASSYVTKATASETLAASIRECFQSASAATDPGECADAQASTKRAENETVN